MFIMLPLLLITFNAIVSSLSSINVNTNYGAVQGALHGNMYKFANIPFAQKPIGNLRFQPPQPIDAWNNTWNGADYAALYFGGKSPACPQIGYSQDPTGHRFGPYAVTEDCLYLNVFTPINITKDSKYAVMIWIYGGSFISGWSTLYIYDPTETIDYIKDIIIVSINYRVGLFGSLYDTQYNTGIQGNQGFLDQKMAIRWVYENIENFGGDSKRLTVYGESAGAHSVALHLLYNNEYLQGGIMESPPIGMPLRDTTTWFDVPEQLSKVIGCDNYDIGNASIMNCWQSVDWIKILNAQFLPELITNFSGGMPFTPTVNTSLIPYQPVDGFQNENILENVPAYIVGVNRDESFSFIDSSIQYTYEFMYNLLLKTFGTENIVALILDYYRVDANSTNIVDMVSRISTDSAFRCPVRNISMNSNKDDIWYYHFDVVNTPLYQVTFGGNQKCWNRTCHTAELVYIWLPQNLSILLPNNKYDEESINIAHQLQTYWTDFAKYKDPNNGNGVWMEYQTDSQMYLEVLDDHFNHSVYVSEEACDFWDMIGYAGRYCRDCKIVQSNTTHNGSLSAGAIVGITIAGLCVMIFIAYFIWTRVYRSRSYKKDEVLMSQSDYDKF